MRTSLLRSTVAWLAGCLAAAALAQSQPPENPQSFKPVAPPTAAEILWNELHKARQSGPREPGPQSADSAARSQARKAAKDQLLGKAETAAADRKTAAGQAAAALRRAEVKSRLLAELLSEEAPDLTAFEMAMALRFDATLRADDRYEIARLQEMLLRKMRKFAGRDEWLLAREEGARRLLREFPGTAAAHGELLQVAFVSPGPRAIALAQQVADSSAPGPLRRAAADLVQRHSIDGRNIGVVLGGVAGAAPLLQSFHGKRVVFYTWMPEDESSVARAEAVGAALPAGSIAIGINLGPDAAAALSVAENRRLPGEQIYGARGHDSPVVRRLALTATGLVLAAGSDGSMRNLSGERDLARALAELN